MATVTAVILTWNMEDHISQCLQALDFVNACLVVDRGSTDATVAKARQSGAKVVQPEDWLGFGRQRQRAEALVNTDWILMVDADERVTALLREEIKTVLEQNPCGVVYTLPRLTWAFGRYIRHGGWYPDRVIRLYRPNEAGYDDARVHERVQFGADVRVSHLSSPLLHFTYRNLKDYLYKSADYAAAWAETREIKGQRGSLGAGLLHGWACFMRMYVLRRGFLDGQAGLLLATLSAHSTLAKYADLWIRQHDHWPRESGL